MKKSIYTFVFSITLALFALHTLAAPPVASHPAAAASITEDERVPAFSIKTLDGATFDTAELKGKVLLVNFWATWCPPCRAEMPRLEKEVWQKHKGDDFAMVAVARQETEDVIAAFGREQGYTFPFAADPDRAVYKLFATEGIPRNYVVGADGRIIYSSIGYSPEEFDEMKRIINKELKKLRKAK